MSFLMRGRPIFGRIVRAVADVPEPVTAATGLPAAAPAPAAVTDDLSASDVCAGCMTRERQRDDAIEAARLNGIKAEQAKTAWYREKGRADKAEAALAMVADQVAVQIENVFVRGER